MPSTFWKRSKMWFNNRLRSGKRETEMAKKKNEIGITYTDGDVPEVQLLDGILRARCPISFNLPPNGRIQLNLGVKFDRPVQLIVPRNLDRDGLMIDQGDTTYDSDTVIRITLFNRSPYAVPLDPSLLVAKFAVLGQFDLEVGE